jgi:uncharacterized protein (TIGR02646 family)
MLRVDKSKVTIPDVLQKKGVSETQKLNADYEAGIRSFDFQKANAIYGHPTVKTLLRDLQHGKCCYCELSRPYSRECDVEHFRPKGGYKVDENSPLVQPGYYWLAYEFSNLFYACKTCNQEFKDTYFPIENEKKRAKNHLDDIKKERALLIDPSLDEPQRHIFFEKEIAKYKTKKGQITIHFLGLNNLTLIDERLKWYGICEELAKYARQGSESAKKQIRALGQPNMPFSLMVRSNFSDLM